MYTHPSYAIDSDPLSTLDFAEDHGMPANHPSQNDIDAAWSVKVFLDLHPGRQRSISMLSLQSGLPEERLREAFEFIFHERLDRYWEKMQWKELSNGARHVTAV